MQDSSPSFAEPNLTSSPSGRSRIVEIVASSVVVSALFLGASTGKIWSAYQGFQTSVTQQLRLRTASDKVVHLDEVLTLSTQMAASTGDLGWEERYRTFEPELAAAIAEVNQLAPATPEAEAANANTVSQRLRALEADAFKLVKADQPEAALELLAGDDYRQNREIYTDQIQSMMNQVNTLIEQDLSASSSRLRWAIIYLAVSGVIVTLGWSWIIYLIRSDIRRRQQTEQQLLQSLDAFQKAQDELESIQFELAPQAQQVHRENLYLEEEVNHLIDVVSALQSGDFTREAQVSDRITGIVADMLNQFIQGMRQVIATVNETCLQVEASNLDVENLATKTLSLAQEQVESVEEIQSLMTDINVLSQATLTQAKDSDQSLYKALAEVDRGASEMQAMTMGFESLRGGTDQITRRVESLNAFVEMAAQFAQSQKRVAALTRVLAYNASMVANRAEEQQDPDQFASVAREFAAIATQVNDLAVQTNQSLETLEQRTQQIQSAVSGITDDTQDINNLLAQFTVSVENSSDSFNNLKLATEQMSKLSQQVTRSNEEIAIVVSNTTEAMQTIREDGDKTEEQSRLTQEQSTLMGELIQKLLARMDFFTLNPQDPKELNSEKSDAERNNANSELPDLSNVVALTEDEPDLADVQDVFEDVEDPTVLLSSAT